MNPLSISEIAKFAEATLESGDGKASVERISTDSRNIKKGELFVALRGENFDGHKFIEDVAKAGAAGAIVDDKWWNAFSERVDRPRRGQSTFAIIRANDTLLAYQALAANYRKSLSLKVLCITGSNGKTSTKDFSASVLGRKFRVTKTQGNFNNHVGLPRTILDATSQHEIAVWEIGMNHPGEVAPLAKIAAPDAAIITNIGVAHIEFMGSREAIAQEKGELAEAVSADGTVILNADDPFSEGIAKRTHARVVFAGINNGVLRATDVEQTSGGSEFTILEGAHRCRAQLSVPGLHMVQNALLAVAAGRAFGVPLEECAIGLTTAPLTKARLQIKEVNGVHFLDDSYNANPDSMKAALRTLIELTADGKRIAILGEMRELGAESQRGHEEVGQEAADLGVDQLIGIGEMGGLIANAAKRAGLENSITVRSTAEAADVLLKSAQPGDLILIKGSRLARTEDVIEHFASRHSSLVTRH